MDIAKRASEILKIQQEAVNSIRITEEMLIAIDKIASMQKKGRIITTGMGKAGMIAVKMSATLSSIGLSSFFVHPAEAAHGDLGRIAPEDLIIVFSHSGSTSEVVNMIAHINLLNHNQNYVIFVGSVVEPKIPSNLSVSYGAIKESCVVSKVPSTSTTLMLLIADVLAITAAESLGFNDGWFKERHPGGAIGVAYKENK
jgi:arabinose-5-phosphate isomerase